MSLRKIAHNFVTGTNPEEQQRLADRRAATEMALAQRTDEINNMSAQELASLAAHNIAEGEQATSLNWSADRYAKASALANLAVYKAMTEQSVVLDTPQDA